MVNIPFPCDRIANAMQVLSRDILIILLGCVLISIAAAKDVKVLKKHAYYNTTAYDVFLVNVNLQEIELEAFKNAEVYSLFITSNPLKEIKKGTFVNVSTNEMYIVSNAISTVEPGSFHDLHPLEENGISSLSLTGNKLEGIRKGIFNKTKFRSLYLDSNRIRYIEPGSFEGMPHLLGIDLEDNLLERIDTGVFQNLVAPSFWVRLIFRNNKLTFVDAHAFENTILYTLDLRDNKLGALSPMYFKNTSIGTFLL